MAILNDLTTSLTEIQQAATMLAQAYSAANTALKLGASKLTDDQLETLSAQFVTIIQSLTALNPQLAAVIPILQAAVSDLNTLAQALPT